MSYNSKKFYPVGEVEYYDDSGFKRTKTIFKMTRAYVKYLRLKHKLEYQYRHYGEVDKHDFDEYVRLIQQSYAK